MILIRQLIPRRPRISKFRRAACPRRREPRGPQQRVGGAAGVEGGVYVEEGVALGHVMGVGGGLDDGGVVGFEVGDVKEVGRGETVWFVYFGGVRGAVV